MCRLIETWDVLKWRQLIWPPSILKINRNMGCIEIIYNTQEYLLNKPINRNMGCIEIKMVTIWS